jgi:tetratricopeptide (TPR) repeat protein
VPEPLPQNEATELYEKGLLLYKLERYDEAIEYYDKALEIDPKYMLAWYNKGLVLDN